MGLVGFITFTRYLALLTCLAVFGLDMYFITLYETHNEVALVWQFFTQTSIIGAMILTIVLSEISFRIMLYRQRHREQQYAHDFGEHNSYLAEASGAGPGAVAIPEPRTYKRRRTCCSTFWSIVRFCWMWILSAGVLHVTIRSFTRQSRSVFVLPFLRDTASDYYYYGRYKNYDPKDLFNCQEGVSSNELSYLCRLDNVATLLAAAAGLILVVEAVATIIFENRDPMSSKSSSFKDPLVTKHRTEPINQEELANSHVVVVGPQPMELQPYGVYQEQMLHQHTALPPTPSIAERSLPPLPPRSVNDGDDGAEEIYSAQALPDKKKDLPPNVWASAADEKSKMKESYGKMPEEEPVAYETLQVEDENQAGPSHSYPRDVKRP
ncbi:hypothetical protein BGZ68_004882 [Mortierella alpina]|nr:hypothetical protein BGZ68_004882 [Mortierella alpina]